MSNYTPTRYGLPRGIDEVGLRHSTFRLPGESNANFRRRVLLQSRKPPGPSSEDVISSVNRTVGQFEKRVMKISLVTDSSGVPVVPDPYIAVTSTRIYVYSDFANSTVAKVINIWDRSGSYFVRDVYNQLSSLAFLTVEQSDDYEEFLISKNIKIDVSERYKYLEPLKSSQCNALDNGLIRSISFDNYVALATEKTAKGDITEAGDFYVDKTNGVVFSYSGQSGNAFYSYASFPFYLWWQPVRVEHANDSTLRYATRDTLINQEDGTESYLSLNAYGAKIANEILSVHPMSWGE